MRARHNKEWVVQRIEMKGEFCQERIREHEQKNMAWVNTDDIGLQRSAMDEVLGTQHGPIGTMQKLKYIHLLLLWLEEVTDPGIKS